jgi:YVTN family beta-propeller protein
MGARRRIRPQLALAVVGLLGILCTIGAGAGVPAASAAVLLPTDRSVQPSGRLTTLQSFPTGAAVSPDGRTVLAIAGPPLQGGLPAGPQSGGVALAAIDAATGAIRQVVNEPDAFQSVVFTRNGQHAYVAGGSAGSVLVLDINSAGVFTEGTDVSIGSFVSGLALSADGRNLWIAEPVSDRVTRLNLGGGQPQLTLAVAAPDQLALSPDGGTLYASDWRGSSVSVIGTATGAVSSIGVGDHPGALTVLPDGRLLVADANDATLATVEPNGATSYTSLALVGRRSDSPDSIVAAPDGRVYVGLGADDAVAVLAPTRRQADGSSSPWRLAGLIPTAWYPTAVAPSPDGATLNVVSGRGLGHSAAATAPYVDQDPAALSPDGAYATVGTLQSLAVPRGRRLAADTRVVRASLAPAPAPAVPVLAPGGPIRHVIYITRENKTYDADLGDLHPGPGNALVLFGRTVTPNLHELETQFSESQNFSYQAFASVTGHMWEDTGTVSDIFERAVASNTAAHVAHVSDSWSDPTNYPASGLLTEQAWKAGLTVRAYNEELAQQSHLLPGDVQAPTAVYPNYDLHVADARREQGWESEFRQFESHSCQGALATTYGAHCSLPALEYVYLGGDHTTVVDEPGYPTIQAQVADNDYATAKVIDAVSHSPDWASTLVIVVEDDPQGTGDHASAYHGLLALASPYVKRGYISNVPYNLTSAVAAIDRILGLPLLTDYAVTSRPLDDLFTTHPDLTPFRADGSGVATYPFTPLPGVPPSSDPVHGIYSFAVPDATRPSVSNAATWRQVNGTPAPPGP